MTEAAGFRWQTLRAMALALLAVKLVLLVVAHPFMDETYYFIWGQHPQLSYFDHPALVGWTQGIAGAVFGWNIVGLRAMVALTFDGDLVLLYLFARRLAGGDWRHWFWTSVLILLATPILFGLTSVALPDHLLIFFGIATIYAVDRLGADPGRLRWLYLAALLIGLATLSKYTGALLAAAALIRVVATPELRPLFRRPHLYLAGLLIIGLQAPVLLWNAQHGFASFGFITGGRAALQGTFNLGGIGGFLLGAVAVLSPFLLIPIARVMLARKDGQGFARLVFWLSTLGFLVASLWTNILIHWNVLAYVAVLPVLAPYLRSRLLLLAQVAYGVLAIGLAAMNYAVVPITAITSHTDQTSGWSYGWDEVAGAVRAIRSAEQIDVVAATDYALASPLAFALADPDVVSVSSRRDAYDDWFDLSQHKGRAVLIVADQWRPLDDAIASRFTGIETVRTIPVTRFGYAIDTYTLYRAVVP
jgi:4-amino-4-deoxy-L-arabinose transferase-like glycosyltransferase